jgi:hypothetical protein
MPRAGVSKGQGSTPVLIAKTTPSPRRATVVQIEIYLRSPHAVEAKVSDARKQRKLPVRPPAD